MRAWKLVGGFGLLNLKMLEQQEVELKANEVKVKIHACSLNYRDLLMINGQYNKRQSLPLIPVSDGAGVVLEVGPGVSNFKVGDPVMSCFSQSWCHGVHTAESMSNTLGGPLDGTLCQIGVFKEQGLIKIPPHLDFVEASTLPCAGVTAFNAIAYQSLLSPSDTVLIEGTGGVALFALQFAKVFGLKIVIISSSDEKIKKAKEIADCIGINYLKNEDWDRCVLDVTDGAGADAVIELGGAKTIQKAIRSVKRGGVICLIGILSGSKNDLDLIPILMKNIRIQGIFVGAKSVFEGMNRVVEHAQIHPIIDRVFDFKDAQKAFSYLESGKHFGKVCIKIP